MRILKASPWRAEAVTQPEIITGGEGDATAAKEAVNGTVAHFGRLVTGYSFSIVHYRAGGGRIGIKRISRRGTFGILVLRDGGVAVPNDGL